MKNLIYQVWAGELRPGCNYSQKLFKKYAKNINADYRLDIDPNIASKICDVPMYFEWLNPILDDSFLEYDNVLVVDMDVFPVAGLKQNSDSRTPWSNDEIIQQPVKSLTDTDL